MIRQCEQAVKDIKAGKDHQQVANQQHIPIQTVNSMAAGIAKTYKALGDAIKGCE
jgi:uncharacterized protein YdbL (DUF1318 family)